MSQFLSQLLLYTDQFGKWLNHALDDSSTGGVRYNWLVIIFILFVVFLVGFTLGRTRMLLALVAIYAAAFIEQHFIYFAQVKKYLPNVADYLIHLGLLLVIYVIVFSILNRSTLKGRLAVKEASIFAITLEAIAIVGFFTSIVLTYLPANDVKFLPASILQYFSTKNAQFVWAVAPVVLAFFLGARKSGNFSE